MSCGDLRLTRMILIVELAESYGVRALRMLVSQERAGTKTISPAVEKIATC